MNKLLLTGLAVMGVAISHLANAISLTPTSSSLVLWGNDSSQSAAQAAIDAAYPGLDLLYKGTRDGNNAAGVSSETFASSYETTYFTPLPDSDAVISYISGTTAISSNPVYAYIKDGNATPNWYLFDISGWNGTDDIEFSSFFVGTQTKNISHVSIYGNQVSVPDGGTTIALLGLGLVGLGYMSRRKA